MATAQYSRKKKVGATPTPENIKTKEVYCELCRIACYKKVSESDTVSIFQCSLFKNNF